MLPKKNRADKKAIEMIFKACPPNGREGKFLNSTNLTFKYIKTDSLNTPRISFIAPKNIAKLAVQRNLLRRCGYSVLKKYIKQFPLGLVGVFVFKKYQDDVLILENEIKSILSKTN
jgi:ribonuclease P protein component